ncbi:MAG: bifunctional UDP-N-acetylmuramoyl-tripeptide:D-alanyl-D-alanine ligase/alanine racemase [Sphingobacteriaceae bacterium]|nr:MAG: bifunctional UDP-N-acetylmuramoyl-tripeptide:D-alanyl-D-alanine ligase/alanine racemase [Pedobacter sp.]
MNHISYSVNELQKVFAGKALISRNDARINTLLIDSRKIIHTSNALFFALKGRRDGHSFIPELYGAGIRSFVIDQPSFDHSAFPDANFYLVENTLNALQRLSRYHRLHFKCPVIAITGSHGKTVVKEWLYQLLSPEYTIVRNPKSYNSQVGVPLSVWEISEKDELAIFEAGISEVGEMENLEKIIIPTIGILTNIGQAHEENFSSNHEKIAEKLKLFKNTDLFIYSKKYLDNYPGKLPGKKSFLWSYTPNSVSLPLSKKNFESNHLEILEIKIISDQLQLLRASYQGKELKAFVPFTDNFSLENVIICWATLLAMGYQSDQATERLQQLIPVNMRLELKDGVNNCSLINDPSSLDIHSLAIALDFLRQQQQHPRRTLILSDIPELGANQDEVYKQVSFLLQNKSIDCLIGVGEQLKQHAYLFPIEAHFFRTTDEFLTNLPSLKLFNETILLKGARHFEFNRIGKILTQKIHETALEINLNALVHNLNYYKTLLRPGVKLMAMVKAFSYGSGSFEIANLLAYHKIDYLAVAYPDEGVSLREAGVQLPIMVMSPDLVSFDLLIENRLEPEIYSHRILQAFIQLLNSKGIENYPVHIKLDTGMHRLGFMQDEIGNLITLLQGTRTIRVQSIFSHLAASEDPIHDDFTRNQIQLFDKLSQNIHQALDYPIIRHLANTSGIDRWPNAQFDMVRLGIGLYGINKNHPKSSPLQTVTSLKTSISQIKNIPAGDTIGYNRKGKMPHGGKTATVKIGYADGYNQALGNGIGKMLINNQYAPTIGKICMDMTMLDVTELQVSEGDQVIVFNDQLKIEDIAQQIHASPYEILTGISQRVKRVYYYE